VIDKNIDRKIDTSTVSQIKDHHRQLDTPPLPHPLISAKDQDASNRMYREVHVHGHACRPEKGRAKDRRRSMARDNQKKCPVFQQGNSLTYEKRLNTESSEVAAWVCAQAVPASSGNDASKVGAEKSMELHNVPATHTTHILQCAELQSDLNNMTTTLHGLVRP